ncbi:hypothetical protein D9M71_491910 [compost metagenome]
MGGVDITLAEAVADQGGRRHAQADGRQDQQQGQVDQHMGHRQFGGTDLGDDPEQQGNAGGEQELVQRVGQRQAQQHPELDGLRPAAQETALARHPPGLHRIDQRAEIEGDAGAQSRAFRAHRRQAQQAVDQAVAQRGIEQVHAEQDAQVHAGAVAAVPEAAEGEVQPHRADRQHPPLEVILANGGDLGVRGQQADDPGRRQPAEQPERQADQ